jgi:pimeloyl-ACP methyl ester carboxylesterase
MSTSSESTIEIELVSCSVNDKHQAALVVIPDVADSSSTACALLQKLTKEFNVFILASELPNVGGVKNYVAALREAFLANGIKRATVFGIGSGATVAQGLAVHWPRIVRRLVVLDATTRLAPGMGSRIIDRMERFFPLGLPLRQLSNNFDSRPFLHRIRCPALLLLSHNASLHLTSQANYIAKKVPNSWLVRLKGAHDASHLQFSDELQDLLNHFLQVPVKRPQKGISTKGDSSSVPKGSSLGQR